MHIEKKLWEQPKLILLSNDIVQGGTTTNSYPGEAYGNCLSPYTCYTSIQIVFPTGAATSMEVFCGGVIVPACS